MELGSIRVALWAPCLVGVLLAAASGCATSGTDIERPTAADASALPPDFPVYPGAELRQVDRGAGMVTATMRSAEVASRVAPSYAELLGANGWRNLELRETGTEWGVTATKGRRTAMLVVTDADGGSTIELLLVKRPKRHERRERPAP